MDIFPSDIIHEICIYLDVGSILRLSECCKWIFTCINDIHYNGICAQKYPLYAQKIYRWNTYEKHMQLLRDVNIDMAPILSAIGPSSLYEPLEMLLHIYHENAYKIIDAIICIYNIPYIYTPIDGSWREYWRVIWIILITERTSYDMVGIMYMLDKYWIHADMWKKACFKSDWLNAKWELFKTDHIYKIESLNNYINHN